MTLITLCTRVTDEVGLPRPNAVATGTLQLERQLFALANATLEELCEKNWPVLSVQHAFTTAIGTSQYALPVDWSRPVDESAYQASQYYPLRGSLTPNEWGYRKNSWPSSTDRTRYRIFGNPLKINLIPTPDTVEDMVIEYISTNAVLADGGGYLAAFTNDSDTPVVPEELVRMGLKWRIKHAKGLDYTEDWNKYERRRESMLAEQMNLGSQQVSNRPAVDTAPLTEGYVPDHGFG
jgi:hypothetical protein